MSAFYWLPAEYNRKSFNKHTALDLIRFSGGGVSHTDLANRPGLKRAGLSRIVNDLLKKRAGQEASVRSTPNGQPPESLEVIPRSGVFGVIDMGEIHINAAVQFALEQENALILEIPEGIYLPALVHQTLRRWSSIRY